MLTSVRPERETRPRRFYKGAEAAVCDGEFGVLLDGRRVRTPAGARLALPGLALALELPDYALVGLAFGAALYKSTVLAFAVQRGRLSGVEALDLSRLDEAFQEERWGVDADAAIRTARQRTEAQMLDDWFKA